jgi:hypothetical protein
MKFDNDLEWLKAHVFDLLMVGLCSAGLFLFLVDAAFRAFTWDMLDHHMDCGAPGCW